MDAIVPRPIDGSVAVDGVLYGGLETLRRLPADKLKEPAVRKRVASEIEGYFLNEMLKAMRRTVASPTEGMTGGEIFTGLIDMELSRFLAKRGTGVADMVLKAIERKSSPAGGGAGDRGRDVAEVTGTPGPRQPEGAPADTARADASGGAAAAPSATAPAATGVTTPDAGATSPAPSVVQRRASEGEAPDSPHAHAAAPEARVTAGTAPTASRDGGAQGVNPFLAMNALPDLRRLHSLRWGEWKQAYGPPPSPRNPFLAMNAFPDVSSGGSQHLTGKPLRTEGALSSLRRPSGDGSVGAARTAAVESGQPPARSTPRAAPAETRSLRREDGGSSSTLAAASPPEERGGEAQASRPAPFLIHRLPVDGRISSYFGMRKHPITGRWKMHDGVDIAAPAGTPIHAVGAGRVVYSGWQKGYGNIVVIEHAGGVVTKYAHNEVNLVDVGDEVNAGDVVARVGSTGMSTGPHVHFEVRYAGRTVDPLDSTKEYAFRVDNK